MSLYEYATKVWKERPPGPEQLLLNEMFENGSIGPHETPESVRTSNVIFQNFTPKVFAVHFRKTKAISGRFVSDKGTKGVKVAATKNENVASGSCQIAELGAISAQATTQLRSTISLEVGVVDIINPPFTTWTYTDHELKNDYVCVVMAIFTGSKSSTFDISEDGFKVIVKFTWPSPIHRPAEFFYRAIKDKVMNKQHPMIHAMATNMLDSGLTDNSTPEGQWIIPLPCKVRREVTSYSMEKIIFENTRIFFLKFTAYQNDIIIEQANKTMKFE